MLNTWKSKILDTYAKHENRLELSFFIGGFVFDILFLAEVDDLFSLVQQAAYLLIIAFILHYEVLQRSNQWRPSEGFVQKVWHYQNLILHFFLGSLLSVYSLFYIKSSSLAASLIFLLFMIGLLIANELPAIKKSNVSLKVGLFAICLFSFVSILSTIILGFVGWVPFGLSVVITLSLVYLQFRFLKLQIPDDDALFRAVLFPGISILVVFSIFYVLGWIPPVPLNVKYQGIFHLVEKKDGKFLLHTEKPDWKFWHSGDQDFKARPGDKIYFYAQVYSPAKFSDQIFIQWFWKHPAIGWQKTDRIPLQIAGGRQEGFRGYGIKSNYQPGQWRVQVETSVGHEVSRLYFEVTEDASVDTRTFKVLEK